MKEYQILLVENDSDRRNMHALNLEMYLGAKVFEIGSTQKAIDHLTISNFDLLICLSQIADEDTANRIVQFLDDQGIEIPIIVMGDVDNLKSDSITFLPAIAQIHLLISTAAKILKITSQQMVKQDVPDYFPVLIKMFRQLDSLDYDIYFKKKNKDDKSVVFELKHPAGTPLDQKSIAQYAAQGITHLFVPQEQRLKLTSQITLKILAMLSDEKINDDERIQHTDEAMAFVQREIYDVGLTPEVIDVCKKTVKSIGKTIRSAPKLRKFLKQLMNNKTSFSCSHCILINYISKFLIERLPWGSEEQITKIVFISFFHDMALSKERLVKINSHLEMEEAGLDDKEKELVEKHALKASMFMAKFPSCPVGADQLIKQHHGVNNGIGFPETVSLGLSPLTIVFMISEDFAHATLKSFPDKLDINVMIQELYKKYTKNSHQRIIDLLKEIKVVD